MEDVIVYHVNNEVKVWLSERVRHRLYAKGRARRGDFSMVRRGWRDFLYLG